MTGPYYSQAACVKGIFHTQEEDEEEEATH